MVLDIRFLNVGHGDCTIVKFPSGRIMMVDINNSKSLPGVDIDALAENKGLSVVEFEKARYSPTTGASRSWEDYYKSLLVDPVDYFKDNFPGSGIFRYVQTHPDMDHMSGLHRLFWNERTPLENFWSVDHAKEFQEEDFTNSPYAYEDWLVFQLLSAGHGPDGPDSHKALSPNRGAVGSYWQDDGIQILSPSTWLEDKGKQSGNYNDSSFVLKLSHAGRSVILPGDAESVAWTSILATVDHADLACDVLKASHHGRESGYHKGSVEVMGPDSVICSVGKKPSTDASDEYASHGCSVFSTRYHGTIRVRIWNDGDIWIEDKEGNRLRDVP